jgi:hypothetical protein
MSVTSTIYKSFESSNYELVNTNAATAKDFVLDFINGVCWRKGFTSNYKLTAVITTPVVIETPQTNSAISCRGFTKAGGLELIDMNGKTVNFFGQPIAATSLTIDLTTMMCTVPANTPTTATFDLAKQACTGNYFLPIWHVSYTASNHATLLTT